MHQPNVWRQPQENSQELHERKLEEQATCCGNQAHDAQTMLR
jgi:hypothetical protein